MASAIMHLCIAKKVNEVLKKHPTNLYLGAIAPDISKQIGLLREVSHFGIIPNLEDFIEKYPKFYKNDFELGYYIHLYSDFIWEKYFKRSIFETSVKFLNGEYLTVNSEDVPFLIYNDYTSLNHDLIDHYLLELDLFYDEVPIPKTTIKEIPIPKIQIIVDKMGVILTEMHSDKKYIFDSFTVFDYIDKCSEMIISDLKRFGL